MHSVPAASGAPSAPAPAPAVARKARHRPGVLEALIALCILVSLSGVLMPAIGSEIGKARQGQVYLDMQAIASGLAAYSRDTLTLPTGVQGRTNVAWLYGPGLMPDGNSFDEGGESRPLDDALLNARMGGTGWKGPYAAALQPDPWGHAYLVNVEGWVDPREHAMVLSAGPNGRVETRPTVTRAAGDDLLLVID